MKNLYCIVLCIFSTVHFSFSQGDTNDISIRTTKITGSIYMLDGVGGFGGGNVAVSVGKDGILLVDDMYASMAPKIYESLKKISDRQVRIVVNTHFHGDHIQGNKIFGKEATIIAHENTIKRLNLQKANDPFPAMGFAEKGSIRFNEEDIRLIHLPNSHTDGDLVVYFEASKVMHMGDTFFFGMFPAVYKEGGGDIKQLIVSLEKILIDIPSDTKVVPGHGELATMSDLKNYVTMLKETVGIVESALKQGKSAKEVQNDKVILKYSALGEGGAQTLEQYVAMLFKLLSPG
jgi:cyclase